MDRRKFLQLLGIGGTAAIAPAVVAGQDGNNPHRHRQEMFKWYRSGEKKEPITLLAIPSTKSVDGVGGKIEKQSFHGTPIVWDDDDYDPNRVYIARHRSND